MSLNTAESDGRSRVSALAFKPGRSAVPVAVAVTVVAALITDSNHSGRMRSNKHDRKSYSCVAGEASAAVRVASAQSSPLLACGLIAPAFARNRLTADRTDAMILLAASPAHCLTASRNDQ